MQQHVIEHTAQSVAGARVLDGFFHRLSNGNTQGPRVIRVFRQQFATELGLIGWTGEHLSAPDLHHGAPIGFRPVGRTHLPDFTVNSELGAGKGQGRAPLPRPGFCGQALDPLPGVIEHLGYSGIGFVGARRTDPLVLVENLGRGIEQFFQPSGTKQRCGSPKPVDIQYLAGNIDVAVRAHLLGNQRLGKQGGEILRSGRLQGARV